MKPTEAKDQVAGRVKTGDVKFEGVNFAGGKFEKQPELLINDG